MIEHEFGARAQICRWLQVEKPFAFKKINRLDDPEEIIKGAQFDRSTTSGSTLHSHADRAKTLYEQLGGSTVNSRQQLAKHIFTVSFLLLSCERRATDQKVNDNHRLSLNLRLASLAAKRTDCGSSYEELNESIDHMQSGQAERSFDINDRKTWAPWVKNLGMAANMLVTEIVEHGPLPQAGVTSGTGLDNLLVNYWEQPSQPPDTPHQA